MHDQNKMYTFTCKPIEGITHDKHAKNASNQN